MGELKADQQVGAGPLYLVFGNEGLPQAGQLTQVRLVDQQLVRIGPTIVADGHRLPAPDQLRATRAEPAPAPQRQFARPAVSRPIPTLHRQNRETVADRHSAGQVVGL